MCGIVGFWSFNARQDPDCLDRAVCCLHHRGPDGKGTFHFDRGPSFGHTRLAVIELSDAGAQPMVSGDERFGIVFNGEIYNHRELAHELSACGYDVKSNSDTEVVLAAYRKWGLDCVSKFIGMFAFAIWDGGRRELLLCRDRAGVKPLHYRWSGDKFSFASELKALRALPEWNWEVDASGVGEFLQYGYIATPGSIYCNTHKLEPGSWLRVSETSPPEVIRYWRLPLHYVRGDTDAQLEEELEKLLNDSLRYRLVSDVQVGLFLSGGVDSSLVASLLCAQGVSLNTFTVGFTSTEHDETHHAKAVAQYLGLQNTSMTVCEADAVAVFDNWPTLFDEPFGDQSGIPTFLLAKLAGEHVKVVLSGDGADEMFCGYNGYHQVARRMRIHSRLPRWTTAVAASSLGAISESGVFGHTGRSFGSKLRDTIYKAQSFIAAKSPIDSVRPFRSFWQPADVRQIIGQPYVDRRLMGHPEAVGKDPMEQLAALDFNEYLMDDVLLKVDRATMAASIEAREPLLDHRLLEFAFSLPLHLRYGTFGSKHLLKKILFKHVPRSVVDRPKTGFSPPMTQWLRRWISSGSVNETLRTLNEKLHVLDGYDLDELIRRLRGSPTGQNKLWLLHVLGKWAETWA